ncbi:MAG: zinc-dependent peptidase [Acidimicrobiales bacterium]|nr:zinc-dependent peptidase [Acidimicrobiales bacterium]HRW37975.1 M90 family metallopeptidase [Aquihabitans sp.]
MLRRRRPKPLPDDWEDRVARMDPGWWDRSVEVRTRIRDLAEVLLGQARWEAARGFEITDDVRLLVVTQAVRLLVGMEVERFPDVRTVIVHDTTIVGRGERPGPAAGVYADDDVLLAGEAAHGDGPIVLAWDEVAWDVRHPRRGRNVVLHEFAHKLDMQDGVVDGTPLLLDPALGQRWVEVCTRTFHELEREGSPVLDDYGTVDAGEFFAVATEAFFCRPAKLREHHPDLYEVFAAYYRQDPAP